MGKCYFASKILLWFFNMLNTSNYAWVIVWCSMIYRRNFVYCMLQGSLFSLGRLIHNLESTQCDNQRHILPMDRPSYIGIFFLQLSTHMLTCAQILFNHIDLKMVLLVCDKLRLCLWVWRGRKRGFGKKGMIKWKK